MINEANLKDLNNDLDLITNKLDGLQVKQDLGGANVLNILNKQLDVIKNQMSATEDLLEYNKLRKDDLERELLSYGFEINDDGTMEDTAKKLEVLKTALSESEFDIINEKLEEYFEIAINEIGSLENSLVEHQLEYQEVLKQKLEATEEIESKITEMYEKQLEERIEAIEKQRDAQIKALEDQKDAYQKWRNEVDYEDDYNKQLQKVQELQAQIEIAKRDDSLSG